MEKITLCGTVERIIFENSAQCFVIFVYKTRHESIIVKGNLPQLVVGQELELSGSWIMHPKFGKQFEAAVRLAEGMFGEDLFPFRFIALKLLWKPSLGFALLSAKKLVVGSSHMLRVLFQSAFEVLRLFELHQRCEALAHL